MTRPIIRAIIKPIIRGIKRAADTLLFQSDLQNSLIPAFSTGSGTPTYTRATPATVPDFEGIVRTALSGEARFKGSRRVHNLITASEDMTDGAYTPAGGASVVSATVASFDGTANAEVSNTQIITDLGLGRQFRFSAKIGSVSGTLTSVQIAVGGAAITNIEADITAQITATPKRFSILAETDAGGTSMRPKVFCDDVASLYISEWLCEEVTGQANQNPSEYVSSGVGTGAEIFDGAFTSSQANWTDNGGNSFTSDGTTGWITEANPLIIEGSTYQVTFEVTDYVSGNVIPYANGTDGGSYSANGTYSTVIVAGSQPDRACRLHSNSFNGTVINLSYKKCDHGANVDAVAYPGIGGLGIGAPCLNGNTVSDGTVADGPEEWTTSDGLAANWESTGNSNTVVNGDTSVGEVVISYVDGSTGPQLDLSSFIPTMQNTAIDFKVTCDVKVVGTVYMSVQNGSGSQVITSTSYVPATFDTTWDGTGDMNLLPASLGSGESISIKNISVKSVSSNVVTEATGIPITDYGVDGVTNGDFATDSDWTLGATWTISGGTANFAGAGSDLLQTEIFGDGVTGTFLVEWDQTLTVGTRTRFFPRNHNNGANLQTIDSSPNLGSGNANGSGSFWALISTTDGFAFKMSGDGNTGTVDNVTARPVHYYADANGPYGYMAEVAATNICLQSEDFSTTWTKPAVSVINSNAAVAPDRKTTADQLIDDNSGGIGAVNVQQNLTVTSNVDETISIRVKADDGDICFISTIFFDAGGDGDTYFNLSTGAVGTTASAHTASIEPRPNGWFICSITFKTVTDVAGAIKIGVCDADGSKNATLDGTSSIFVWGAQVEVGSFPTSYNATTTTAVTRNADVLTYPSTSNIIDLAGTVVCEASTDWSTSDGISYLISTGNTGRIIYTNPSESSAISRIYDGSSISISPTGTSRLNSPQAVASTWGTALTPYAPGTLLPDLTPASYDGTIVVGDIGVGDRSDGQSQWGGPIRLLRIYSDEKSDAGVLALG